MLIIRLSYCNRIIRLQKKTQSTTIVHKKQYISTSWKYYHSSRTSLLVEKNNVSPLKKTTTLFNPCQSFSTARFDDYFFQSKSFMRRRVRRYRLRHKIHAIKTKPNNPLRFLQHKNSIRHYLANDLTFSSFAKRRSEHKSVFTTNNTRPN